MAASHVFVGFFFCFFNLPVYFYLYSFLAVSCLHLQNFLVNRIINYLIIKIILSEYTLIICNQFFDANWNAPLKRHTTFFETLAIMLEIPSISNQMCKNLVFQYYGFETFGILMEIQGFVKILGFLFELVVCFRAV